MMLGQAVFQSAKSGSHQPHFAPRAIPKQTMMTPNQVQVSVLMATCRRAELLGQTLEAMTHLATSGFHWELLVVDNPGDEAVRKVCESFTGRLPLRYLVCSTRGQNSARNLGLNHASGELIVLSDDDIVPDENWLREMFEGSQRWPDEVLFGGRILPRWPGQLPDFELDANSER